MAESNIDSMVEKLKNDGFAVASKEKEKIISEAREEAKAIVEEAQKKASKLLEDTKNECAQLEVSAKQAIVQAGRDLLRGIEQQVNNVFGALLKDATASAFEGKVLENAIDKLVTSWSTGQKLEVLLNEQDFKALEANLKNALASKVKGGVEIKPFSGNDKGFKLREEGGKSYYNFTSAEIAEVLTSYLNPRFVEIVRGAAK